MSLKTIDPGDLIDRDHDQEAFRELLRCKEDVRVFTITDKGGRGKSALLRRLAYNCEFEEPKTPSALILLDDLPDATPFKFVVKLWESLKDQVEFPDYEVLSGLYAKRDFSAFATEAPTFVSSMNFSGSQFQAGSRVENNSIKISGEKQTVNIAVSDWNPEQFEIARERCVNVFLKELREACPNRTIVLFLDAWERGNDTLRDFILKRLLHACIFDSPNSPPKLVVVIAGRDVPNFQARLRDRYPRFVRPGGSLKGWSSEHVLAFLKLYGFPDISEKRAAFLAAELEDGASLLDVKLFIENYVNKRAD